MSFDTLTAYRNARDGNAQRVVIVKASTGTTIGRASSSWLQTGIPAAGVAPTTAAVPTNATTGALAQLDSAGVQRLLRVVLSWGCPGGLVTFCDRLSHQGGLSGTATGAQTTNLPTAALTRQTSGVGVMAGLEIYTAIGATATTVSASYTNQAGTSGRTTPLATWGGTGRQEVSHVVMLPLQVGDTGIQAVASVTNTATTGTLGAFGVTLFYPLISIPFSTDSSEDVDVEAVLGMGHWFPRIVTGACLFMLLHTGNNASTGLITGELKIGEE